MVISTTGRFLCNDNIDKLENPPSAEDNDMEIPTVSHGPASEDDEKDTLRLQLRATKTSTTSHEDHNSV